MKIKNLIESRLPTQLVTRWTTEYSFQLRFVAISLKSQINSIHMSETPSITAPVSINLSLISKKLLFVSF